MAIVVDQVQLHPCVNNHPCFAHPSEEEFATLLTFYGVDWLYEPTTFPLCWDEAGHVSRAFSPDFYLPEYDLYIELATRKQGQMTGKHRKIRRLQQLYPDVHIKLVNKRTFEDLLFKFGRMDRAGQLVGKQLTPVGGVGSPASVHARGGHV